MYNIKRKKWTILNSMAERKYELPTTSSVIIGVGVDGGGIVPTDSKKPATTAEDTGELAQWEEARRNMTPEERKTADEAAIRALYGKYMERAGDESLSPEHRERWANAAHYLEDKYPDLFND